MPKTPPYSLRIAVESDIPFLESLRSTTMRPIIENHYPWSPRAQRERVLSDFDWARIIVVDGCDVGLYKVVYGTTEIHLSQIQLLPVLQGRGIASGLIRELQQDALARGLPITLHVLRGNRAHSLYHRLGFAVHDQDEHFLFMKWRPIQRDSDHRIRYGEPQPNLAESDPRTSNPSVPRINVIQVRGAAQ